MKTKTKVPGDSIDKITNPFSSGGGGIDFEHKVGAWYLTSLLAQDIPHGLPTGRGITMEVRFQQRYEGSLVDDIIVRAIDIDIQRKIAVHVKYNLDFSAKDNTFLRVVKDCWKTFLDTTIFQFNENIDFLVIAIDYCPPKVRDLIDLLDWARAAANAEDFFKKVETKGYSSKNKKERLQLMIDSLEKAEENNDLTKDEIWRFLKCLVIVPFDFNVNQIHYWNRILDQLDVRNPLQATFVFNIFKSIVSENAPVGGSVNLQMLREHIPGSIALKRMVSKLDRQTFKEYREHSKKMAEIILKGWYLSDVFEKCKYSNGKVEHIAPERPDIEDIGLAQLHLQYGYPEVWKLKEEANRELKLLCSEIVDLIRSYESKVSQEINREPNGVLWLLERPVGYWPERSNFQGFYIKEETLSTIFDEISDRAMGKVSRRPSIYEEQLVLKDDKDNDLDVRSFAVKFRGRFLAYGTETQIKEINSKVEQIVNDSSIQIIVADYHRLTHGLDNNENVRKFKETVFKILKGIYQDGQLLEGYGYCIECPQRNIDIVFDPPKINQFPLF